jgi:predicted transcriptional regulator
MSADLETTHAADSEPTGLTTKYTRLSVADIRTVLELHDRGVTQVEIAKVISKSQSAVSNALKAFNADSKAVARQLRALTDEAISDWRRAKRIAAKRGDHRPAKELVEAAHPELRPVTAANGGNYAGVTVIVAVPGGAENPLPAIQVRTEGATPATLSPQVSHDIHRLTDDR